jgi:N-terminal acetyltransferase B complex catalytic subunit
VDLFVRVDNEQAKELYKKLGYSVYRVVKGYYSDGCNAWDMRKPLKRDGKKETVIKEGKDPFVVGPDDVW